MYDASRNTADDSYQMPNEFRGALEPSKRGLVSAERFGVCQLAAPVCFTRTSESEASDGWAALHLYAQDRRLRTVHLITGEGSLLEYWFDLPAKGVLSVRTSDEPALRLTGLWVAPEHVPLSV